MLQADLRRLADEVNSIQALRRRAVEKLRAAENGLSAFDALESGLRLRVHSTRPAGKIAAVDGGILGQEFHGIDLFLVRAVAACFEYSEGNVIAHSYWPSPLPAYETLFEQSLQAHEFNWANGLVRLEKELDCALEAGNRLEPKLLLLDGSILPQVGDRPSRDSAVYSRYELVLDKFKELYALSEEKGFWLAGVIKDSRGRHFLDLLLNNNLLSEFAHGLEKTNDTTFLYDFLATGERTPAFKYSSAASEHLVLRDLGEWSKKIASFYLKPVEYDRPLRVDFLLPEKQEEIGELAALINSLSQGNKEYAYPAVLIEADLRAAMDAGELDFIASALSAQTGRVADLLALRRNSRPFR